MSKSQKATVKPNAVRHGGLVGKRLDELRQLSQTDVARALAQAAIELKKYEKRESVHTAEWLCLIGEFYLRLSDYHAAEPALMRAITLSEKNNIMSVKALSLARLGNVHYHQGNYERAIQMYKQALTIQESLRSEHEQGHLLTNIGVMHRHLGNFQASLDAQIKALELKRRTHDVAGEMYSLGNVANVYLDLGDYASALRFYEKGFSLMSEKTDLKTRVFAMLNIANVYILLEDFSVAREWHLRVQSLLEETSMTDEEENIRQELKLRSMFGMAIVQSGLNHFHEANAMYQRCLDFAVSIGNRNWQIVTAMELGKLRVEQSELDAAEGYYQQALSLAQEISKKPQQIESHQALVALYKKKKAWAKALAHHEALRGLEKEMITIESEKHLRQLQSTLAAVEAQRENEKLRADISRKESDLITLAASLVQKNELIERLKSELADLAKQHRGEACYINMIHKLDAGRETEKDWQTFERQFNLIHKNFIETLAKSRASLSATELKICALLKINLSTKDIANMLYISPRTVEFHRANIRKKLKLKSAQGLTEYLTAF
jgi:tetratricopeptide (TPR) repeat protein